MVYRDDTAFAEGRDTAAIEREGDEGTSFENGNLWFRIKNRGRRPQPARIMRLIQRKREPGENTEASVGHIVYSGE